jgi:hypothetical protein
MNPPVMVINPDDTLFAVAKPDAIDSSFFEITNTGGGLLNYTIITDDLPEWMSFKQTEGSLSELQTDKVWVFFNTNGLSTGVHDGIVHLQHNYYNYETLPLKLTVSNTAIIENKGNSPIQYLLAKPNPFEFSTTIDFYLSQSQELSIAVFDLSGRSVTAPITRRFEKGRNSFVWNAKDERGGKLMPGLYFMKVSNRTSNNLLKLLLK